MTKAIMKGFGVFILGVCLSLFGNKKKIDNSEETASVLDDSIAEIELEAAEAETTEVYFAGSSEETGDDPVVFGVHYMAEDLDMDEEEELLAFQQWSDTMGDLLVFHETDGKIEYIIKFLTEAEYTEEEKLLRSGKRVLYKDGEEEKELTYEGIYYRDDDLWEMTPEDRANKDYYDKGSRCERYCGMPLRMQKNKSVYMRLYGKEFIKNPFPGFFRKTEGV